MLSFLQRRRADLTQIKHPDVVRRVEDLPAVHPSTELAPAADTTMHELNELRSSIEHSIESFTQERAEQALNTLATNPFYAANGATIHTLAEFRAALETMNESTFSHHVHDGENHFADWITHCFPVSLSGIGGKIRTASRSEMIAILNAELPRSVQPRHHTPTHVPYEEHVVPQLHPVELPPQVVHITTPSRVEAITIPTQPLAAVPFEGHQTVESLLLDELHSIELLATHDLTKAKERFILVRTRVWQDLSDDERRAVLPKLRSVYETLRK